MARVVVVIETGAQTVRVSDWLAVACVVCESAAETVRLKVPAWEGAPVKMPELFNVKPAGRVPEVRLQV